LVSREDIHAARGVGVNLEDLRQNFLNRCYFDFGPVSDEEFAEAIGADDEKFVILLMTRQDELIDYISRSNGLDRMVVETLVLRDVAAWTGAVSKGIGRRWDTLRQKIAGRFTVYRKNLNVMRNLAGICPDRAGYLDVGCGLGFTMIAAASLGFKKAHGMEVDSNFARTGLKFVPEGFGGEIGYTYGDFLKLACRPPYSLISFFDVLEHIADRQFAVDKALSFLTPEGMIYFYQGNYRSPQMIYLEPHYQLPLLALIPKELAVKVLIGMGRIKSADDYVVNAWPDYEFFTDQQSPVYLLDAERNFRGGEYQSHEWAWKVIQSLPKRLDEVIAPYLASSEVEHVRSLIAQYADEYEAARAADVEQHRRKYLMASWNLIMAKSPLGGDRFTRIDTDDFKKAGSIRAKPSRTRRTATPSHPKSGSSSPEPRRQSVSSD
jgi:SAM-dependent methyltransferase